MKLQRREYAPRNDRVVTGMTWIVWMTRMAWWVALLRMENMQAGGFSQMESE